MSVESQVPIVDKENPLDAPIVESSFATLFPKYREQYIREIWGNVCSVLKDKGIRGELDLVKGAMSVHTTREMYDPYNIIKARDFIKLLARSVPLSQAIRIFQEDVFCDIIKIGTIVRNKERFVKRRQRLIGPNGCTLKAIELLTGCYVMIQGNTVAVLGDWKQLKQVRKIVEDCMKNTHPIYNIKALMIKKELAKDPELANQDWSRFLPQFKKKNVQRKKPKVVNEKKKYTPFPPPQKPSKIDLQLESGEYFLSEKQKENIKQEKKRENAVQKKQSREQKRNADFIAPEEPKKKKSNEENSSAVDLQKLKEKISKSKNKAKPQQEMSNYIQQ